MKKFLSIAFAMMLCVLALSATAFAADAVYTVSDVDSCYPGDEIEITVSLDVNTPFKAAGIANITYNKDALTFNGAEINSDFENKMCIKEFSDMTLAVASENVIESYNGTVLTMSFTVNEDAPAGEYEITGFPAARNSVALEAAIAGGNVVVKAESERPEVSEVVFDKTSALMMIGEEIEIEAEIEPTDAIKTLV